LPVATLSGAVVASAGGSVIAILSVRAASALADARRVLSFMIADELRRDARGP
jgi:hypothetical protein